MKVEWTGFLFLFAFLSNTISVSANNSNNEDIDDGTALKISQSCAPTSRSRRAITVDRMTLTCAESDEQSPSCSVGGFAQVTVDCESQLFG